MLPSWLFALLGEYFVVGVDIDEYNEKNPATYLQGFLTEEADPSAQQAFRHYLGVVPSSPVGFENFTVQVNTYLEKPPFNFSNPLNHLNVTAGKIVSALFYFMHISFDPPTEKAELVKIGPEKGQEELYE